MTANILLHSTTLCTSQQFNKSASQQESLLFFRKTPSKTNTALTTSSWGFESLTLLDAKILTGKASLEWFIIYLSRQFLSASFYTFFKFIDLLR